MTGRPRVAVIAAVTAAMVVATSGTAACTATPRTVGDGVQEATVQRVVDGDTLLVDYGGDQHRVRLLNVDTPESVDPGRPVECLGREASAFLEQRLPYGTRVLLRFDEERLDRYGRQLAGVFVGPTLINAEIARAGLGVAVLFEPNRRFYGDVLGAEREARRQRVGLHAPTLPCSVSAR